MVNNDTPSLERLSAINLKNLNEAAHKHMLAAMVGAILRDAGIHSALFNKDVLKAQRKSIVLNHEMQQVIDQLETKGIWYMPLKGAVLKQYYPRIYTREMADVDILFDANQHIAVNEIMKALGFQVKTYGEKNDDEYIKPPLSNFEMHRHLFQDTSGALYEYYKDVHGRLVKDEGNDFGYHFSPEDFYIYMIAHEYKHYSNSGTGLRSLLDTYVFLQNHLLDMAYIKAETKKLGISEFECQNRELSIALFKGQELTASQHKMFEYILSSGTYGSQKHYFDNAIKKSGGKLQYLKKRVIGPVGKDDPYRQQFIRQYAFFFQHKVLLPFLPFYRLFRALKKSPNRIKSEANAIRKAEKLDI